MICQNVGANFAQAPAKGIEPISHLAVRVSIKLNGFLLACSLEQVRARR